MTIKDTIKNALKVNRKTFLDPRSWLGVDYLANQTELLVNLLKAGFSPPGQGTSETFQEAIQRYHLTEEDIKKLKFNYFIYSIVFLIFAGLTVVFSFYLLISYSTFAGFVLGLATSALLVTMAFWYHFWYFQIEHRKLGCSFSEWKRGKPYDKGDK